MVVSGHLLLLKTLIRGLLHIMHPNQNLFLFLRLILIAKEHPTLPIWLQIDISGRSFWRASRGLDQWRDQLRRRWHLVAICETHAYLRRVERPSICHGGLHRAVRASDQILLLQNLVARRSLLLLLVQVTTLGGLVWVSNVGVLLADHLVMVMVVMVIIHLREEQVLLGHVETRHALVLLARGALMAPS